MNSFKDAKKILDRVNEIKSKLIIDIPLTLPIIKIKTSLFIHPAAYAATNGRVLLVSPEWYSLPNNQAEGVLYHEWCHIALLHPKRLRNKIHKIWNYACDFFIDYHIKKECSELKIAIAPGMLFDEYYNYNWTCEKIYEDLLSEVNTLKEQVKNNPTNENIINLFDKKEDQEEQKNNDTNFVNREKAIRSLALNEFVNDIMADDLVMPSDEDASDKELIREIIRAAELHKKSKGRLPGLFESQINKYKKARVPWEQVFHDIFMDLIAGSEDRSFSKPKRWAMSFDLMLPSETGFEKQDIVLILDSSGSMYNTKIFERFVGEIKKVLQYVNKLTLISSDAEVHEKVDIKSINDIIGTNKKFHFKGGGGTDFRPALQVAAKMKADMVIYYTDGYGTYGDCPRGMSKLLWVLTESGNKPPFGRYLIAEE